MVAQDLLVHGRRHLAVLTHDVDWREAAHQINRHCNLPGSSALTMSQMTLLTCHSLEGSEELLHGPPDSCSVTNKSMFSTQVLLPHLQSMPRDSRPRTPPSLVEHLQTRTVVVTSRTRGVSFLSLACTFFTGQCGRKMTTSSGPTPVHGPCGVCQQKTLEFKQLLIPSVFASSTHEKHALRRKNACCMLHRLWRKNAWSEIKTNDN